MKSPGLNIIFLTSQWMFLLFLVNCTVKPPKDGINDIHSKRPLLVKVKQSHTLQSEQEFQKYARKFPRVSKEDYLKVIKNKPKDWCIFSHFPVTNCQDLAYYEYKRGNLKEARDAYLAVALSEDHNNARQNIKTFGALTQIYQELGDMYNTQVYISKILNINGENRWAKKKLVEVLSTRTFP